ncbi:MAG: PP2C family protein-serine/threonine phosphatase [Oscillospiraceae bacterium]|nr:PP2C family protein-serine/threonine phosphatase [Oscillospiraceae bacterium]
MKNRKNIGMLKQIAILFAVSVVLIGLITSLSLYVVTRNHVDDDLVSRAHAVAADASSYILHFPSHQWLFRYWYENYETMDLQYEVDFAADEPTAEKYGQLNARQEEFLMDYATDADVEALPPEDQKLFAEILYSWLLTRLDSMAKGYECDYLFVASTEEPYDSLRVLFIVSEKDLERGPEAGQLYPVGTVIDAAGARQEAIRAAVSGNPQMAPNENGEYIDYYYKVDEIDGHEIVIGVTSNSRIITDAIRANTLNLSLLSVIFLILVALACLGLVLFFILRPLKKVQDNIRLYRRTKDSGTVVSNLSGLNSQNEIGELSEDVIKMTRELDDYTARIEKITAEKERINTELTLASEIQMAMMPGVFPAFPGRMDFDIYASIKPAREIGGDFYDFFLIDDSHLAMVIADVSGKGVPAALFVMATKITLAHYFRMNKSPAEILTDVNTAINSNNPEDMFVTVWIGILDLDTGRLSAANAGHEYPMLKPAGGDFRLYRDRHGLVVGTMPEITYKGYEIQMEPGSALFLYTDGLPEATSADGTMFGTDRIAAELNARPDAAPQELIRGMNQAVAGFVRDAEQFDDLTMLCLRYHGGRHRDA